MTPPPHLSSNPFYLFIFVCYRIARGHTLVAKPGQCHAWISVSVATARMIATTEVTKVRKWPDAPQSAGIMALVGFISRAPQMN